MRSNSFLINNEDNEQKLIKFLRFDLIHTVLFFSINSSKLNYTNENKNKEHTIILFLEIEQMEATRRAGHLNSIHREGIRTLKTIR